MSTNDRPETLTPTELREQSESWRRAALAWQTWAARVLASRGKQPKGGEHGDDAAREKIEALTKRGRGKLRADPIQDLMLSYRAEAAEQERWLAEITAALGLPADATQTERMERAGALAAQPCCVTFTVPEDWKEPLPD